MGMGVGDGLATTPTAGGVPGEDHADNWLDIVNFGGKAQRNKTNRDGGTGVGGWVGGVRGCTCPSTKSRVPGGFLGCASFARLGPSALAATHTKSP